MFAYTLFNAPLENNKRQNLKLSNFLEGRIFITPFYHTCTKSLQLIYITKTYNPAKSDDRLFVCLFICLFVCCFTVIRGRGFYLRRQRRKQV